MALHRSNAGVQNRHIMAMSGHRSEQSLAHYNTRPSTSQLQQCSDVLSRSLNAENSFFSGNQINDRTQIQEHSVMTTGTSSSFPGSLFNNCTVQQAHVHGTLELCLPGTVRKSTVIQTRGCFLL